MSRTGIDALIELSTLQRESIDRLATRVAQFEERLARIEALSERLLQAIEKDREVALLQAQNIAKLISVSLNASRLLWKGLWAL